MPRVVRYSAFERNRKSWSHEEEARTKAAPPEDAPYRKVEQTTPPSEFQKKLEEQRWERYEREKKRLDDLWFNTPWQRGRLRVEVELEIWRDANRRLRKALGLLEHQHIDDEGGVTGRTSFIDDGGVDDDRDDDWSPTSD